MKYSVPAVTGQLIELCGPQKSSLHASSVPPQESQADRAVSKVAPPQVVAVAAPVQDAA